MPTVKVLALVALLTGCSTSVSAGIDVAADGSVTFNEAGAPSETAAAGTGGVVGFAGAQAVVEAGSGGALPSIGGGGAGGGSPAMGGASSGGVAGVAGAQALGGAQNIAGSGGALPSIGGGGAGGGSAGAGVGGGSAGASNGGTAGAAPDYCSIGTTEDCSTPNATPACFGYASCVKLPGHMPISEGVWDTSRCCQ